MSLIADIKSLKPSQRSAIWASYLGWTLDAFDFFLMVFMLSAIAKEFGTDVKAVSQGVFLTLAARPLGAFAFGWLAERFGRRPVLMADIILFSLFELASGFAPTLTSLLCPSLPVRDRDGRRMGPRRQPGDGVDPAEDARPRLRPPPERLSDRLFRRQPGLLPAVRPHRLARHVHGRRRPRLPRAADPHARRGKPGVRGPARASRTSTR